MPEVRIISGKYKGYTIVDPALDSTRVSKERLREGLFSAINSEIKGATVLDLFAGSGSFGFEAYSRGAKKVIMVDSNFACLNAMKKTLTKMKVGGSDVDLVYGSYPFVLSLYNSAFDYVFLDPPYGEFKFLDIIKDLFRHGVVDGGSTIVIESLEHFNHDSITTKSIRTYKYGINHVTILQGVQFK